MTDLEAVIAEAATDGERAILGFLAWMEREGHGQLRQWFPAPGATVGDLEEWYSRFDAWDLAEWVREYLTAAAPGLGA